MNTQTESPGIARVTGPAKIPPTATPSIDATLEQIQERLNACNAARDLEIEGLKAQVVAIAENQRPAHLILEEHRLRAESIQMAQGHISRWERALAEINEANDKLIANGNGDGRLLHLSISNLIHVERAITETKRWIDARLKDQSETETRLSAVVKERRLNHMLPVHLSHLAAK